MYSYMMYINIKSLCMYRKLFTRMTKKKEKFDFECINRSMSEYNKNITCTYRLRKKKKRKNQKVLAL